MLYTTASKHLQKLWNWSYATRRKIILVPLNILSLEYWPVLSDVLQKNTLRHHHKTPMTYFEYRSIFRPTHNDYHVGCIYILND